MKVHHLLYRVGLVVPEARTDLVKKSKELLMKSWKRDGSIFENYNSVTGQGEDVNGADAFYHWGALLSFLSIMEGQTFQDSQIRK